MTLYLGFFLLLDLYIKCMVTIELDSGKEPLLHQFNVKLIIRFFLTYGIIALSHLTFLLRIFAYNCPQILAIHA